MSVPGTRETVGVIWKSAFAFVHRQENNLGPPTRSVVFLER